MWRWHLYVILWDKKTHVLPTSIHHNLWWRHIPTHLLAIIAKFYPLYLIWFSFRVISLRLPQRPQSHFPFADGEWRRQFKFLVSNFHLVFTTFVATLSPLLNPSLLNLRCYFILGSWMIVTDFNWMLNSSYSLHYKEPLAHYISLKKPPQWALPYVPFLPIMLEGLNVAMGSP